jgi:hypothetical protein
MNQRRDSLEDIFLRAMDKWAMERGAQMAVYKRTIAPIQAR